MRGYTYVRTSTKPGVAGYTSEHHLVWEIANGPLPKGMVVHHLNGNKADNRLENLLALSRGHHHSHPRETLVPYEQRIYQLESQLANTVDSLPDISN